ncbi:MAG: DUF928 domain-containing protein [Cyanobacteria bacterium J06642_11]
MASTLALGSSVLMLTAAHGAQRMSAPPQPTQQQAQFTPPDDSQVDGDTILTSTGTYFRPPSDPSPTSGPRTSTGTRQGGCLGVTETAFAIFGPKATDKVVGQTASTRPTFVWHLPETERRFPVIFRLLAPDTDGIPTAIYQTTFDYTPGFISHQLPVPVPALSQGIEYRWQVIIECNPAYPSRAMLQELSFEVVPGPTGLSQTLAAANTSTERAIAYGQAGMWYDAIAEVAAATTPEDQQTRSGLLTDLAASLPDTEAQLQQDILGIVETAR